MKKETKNLITAISIISGTCIGAGFLGIPYVASRAGFPIALAYLTIFSAIILLINLYLGEIILRTKGNHQLAGYAKKYLGEKGKKIMLLATKFTIYSAIIAYIIGVGESLSFLLFGEIKHYLTIGIFFGLMMSVVIKKGISFLKDFEKVGIFTSIALLFFISITFFSEVNVENLLKINLKNILLPFGVILFSMTSFFSIPQAKIILKNNKKLMKKAIIIGTILPVIFYLIFTLIVVGAKGGQTPEIATFALGKIFVVMGIIAMFTSYLSLGNALQQNYIFDYKNSKRKAWIKATIIPIIIFIITQFFEDFFSFIRVISIAGVISGGIITILVLIIKRKSEKFGEKSPEYIVPINKAIAIILSLIFIFGIVSELFKIY